jgi:hypothetical protein
MSTRTQPVESPGTHRTGATKNSGVGRLSRKGIKVGGCLTPEVGFPNGFIVGERLQNVSYVQSLPYKIYSDLSLLTQKSRNQVVSTPTL